jgi:4-methyl-5(b-hydroxyethyl)-thiazole monophosphate biosynthesis
MYSTRNILSRSSTFLALLTLSSHRPIQAFQSILPLHRAHQSSTASHLHSMSPGDAKQVLVPIADGSEEIETTCITDTLTRFGAKVTIASVKADGNLLCTMSRGIKVQADTTIAQAVQQQEWDLIVLPGGMPGAEHLRDCEALIELLLKQKKAGKLYGAICAAPAVALAPKGLIDSKQSSTCYPAPKFREKLANPSEEAVVVADNLTTSQGPGTALQFALQLGEQLYGKEARAKIAKEMLVD